MRATRAKCQKYDWSNVGSNSVARAARTHNMLLPQYLRTTRTYSSKCFAHIWQHCWIEIIVEYLQLLKDSLSLRLPLYFFSLSKRAILESGFREINLLSATTRFAAWGVGLRYPYRFASCFFERKTCFLFCAVNL